MFYRFNWFTNSRNYYKYRQGPVPRTGKIKGGDRQRMPKVYRIKKDLANPEMKGYTRNRGWMPDWWDDFNRRPQRCWKEQRKTRHQWQR